MDGDKYPDMSRYTCPECLTGILSLDKNSKDIMYTCTSCNAYLTAEDARNKTIKVIEELEKKLQKDNI